MHFSTLFREGCLTIMPRSVSHKQARAIGPRGRHVRRIPIASDFYGAAKFRKVPTCGHTAIPLASVTMNSIIVFAVTLLLVTCSQIARAAPAECPACRAMHPYGRCPETSINNPPKNSIGFIGSVVAAKPTDCGVQITVRVTRSSSPSLPETIVIDIGPCSFWWAATGDTISAAVFEAPEQTGVYRASLYCPADR
jgi:hypothetical protein